MRVLNTRLLTGAVFALASTMAAAVPMTTLGDGAAVTTVNRQALFSGFVGAGQSMLGYTEDGLLISVTDTHCCSDGRYYGDGGNSDFVTITTTDDALMYGLEFDFYTGYGTGLMNLVWETLRDGVVTGSGLLTDVFAPNIAEATVPDIRGWKDTSGFDTLRVAAGLGVANLGDFQAIGLDNVQVDLNRPDVGVPEPTALSLLALALAGLRRRPARA